MLFVLRSFGLNPNILETNVINLLILGALIFSVGKNFFSSTVEDRRKQILKTFETLDANYDIANKNLIRSENGYYCARLMVMISYLSNEDRKKSILDRRYESLIADLDRLFSLANQNVDNSSQETFQYLQKYLVVFILGQILREYSFLQESESVYI